MPHTKLLIRTLTEDEVTKEYLNKDENTFKKEQKLSEKTGVTDYPILEFDERALELLHQGVHETLKHSKVKPAGGKAYLFFKRAFDIVASSLGLIILAIPMGVIALVIYLDDHGNPIFKQIRLTENGKPFEFYKFRSMKMNAEEEFEKVQKENQSDGLAFKSENDPRITRVGRFLRKTSLDELPQLFNCLLGSMSIIGPRPPLPREVVMYTPEQMDRLLVKGGLSCICQTEGRSDMPFDEWVKSDVKYIKTRSVGVDLKLVFKTIGAVVLRKGAR